MEDESRNVPRALSVEMMDERPWPASRLEELVFKRGVSGKIDIIISRARIFSHCLALSFESKSFFRRTLRAKERILSLDFNWLPGKRSLSSRSLYQICKWPRTLESFLSLTIESHGMLKNIPSSFSLSSSRSSDRLSSSSSSSWERCDAPASLPDCSPTLPLPAVFERFRTGLWPLEEPETNGTDTVTKLIKDKSHICIACLSSMQWKHIYSIYAMYI